MNKVILMGRLTRDPEVRYTTGDNQMAIARYTLAVDRRYSKGSHDNGESNADFIPCVVFGKGAEFSEKYLRKGTKIAVTGRIQTGSYTNRDGVKVYTTEVVVEDQEFAESKNASGGGQNSNYNSGGDYGNGGYGNGNSGGNSNSGYGNAQNGAPQGNNAGTQGNPPQRSNYYNNGGYGQNSGYNNGGNGRQQSGRNGGNYGNGPQGGQPAPAPAPQQMSMDDDLSGFMNIPDGIDEELPFA